MECVSLWQEKEGSASTKTWNAGMPERRNTKTRNTKLGSYSGTAGDSLGLGDYDLNNMAFTTKDRDKDRDSQSNCAVLYTGAWWYKSCHNSNLNGNYVGQKYDGRGLKWHRFRGDLSLKFTEMKLRPSS